ncbi:hypothetical protein [Amycolatopsis sp. 195334CR]|uniref:hypothetical protein n=1 Tax=Amycolatopsis sp. 195334CR TaxID=2814588 RepID=UPI001A8C9F31|nr:hypothetical protein [Amycolatopsis sp. 195334CR]MBN6039806.1 hypothetical protein [Amycolatopsis sp. 195334CR]
MITASGENRVMGIGWGSMLHIRFTDDDLLRTTLGPAPDRVLETVLALDLFAGRGGGRRFAAWRERTAAELPMQARSLVNLARVLRPVPDMLAMARRADPAEPHHLRRALDEFHRIAVAPYQDQVVARVQADHEIRLHTLLTSGLDHLLGTLDPGVHWRNPVLALPAQRHREIRLDGRGLRLSPVHFLRDRPALLLEPTADHPATLLLRTAIPVYPPFTRPDRSSARTGALRDLLGSLPARLLHGLAAPRTTAELVELTGIPADLALRNLAVLRASGLVVSRRVDGVARHLRTPLGTAMVEGTDPGPAVRQYHR